jgi:hypothetical protein
MILQFLIIGILFLDRYLQIRFDPESLISREVTPTIPSNSMGQVPNIFLDRDLITYFQSG